MKYNQDEMLLTSNTHGDRWAIWHDGNKIVQFDMDSDETFITWAEWLNKEQAEELVFRALVNEVRYLRLQVGRAKDALS